MNTKNQLCILLIILIVQTGCGFNRKGAYTQKIFKTANNKVIVTGTVSDVEKNNEAMPGVALLSEDREVLTNTGNDGKYSLELKEGEHILYASYLGFKTKSTKRLNLIRGDSLVINFTLKNAHETLY